MVNSFLIQKNLWEKKEVAELISVDNGLLNTLIKDYASNILTILFGNEFGLFWTSPIYFYLFQLYLYFFLKEKYKIFFNFIFNFYTNFGIVLFGNRQHLHMDIGMFFL